MRSTSRLISLFAIYLVSYWLMSSFNTTPPSQPVLAQSSDPLVISEFLASNAGNLLDEDGDASDWIELHNTGSNTISLQGYFLTDDSAAMNQWAFPNMTIAAGERLIIFASKKDRAVAGSELHTNFKLSAGGEYLAISDGESTIASEFSPLYPQQYEDVSFGLNGSGSQRYFTSPTPGSGNGNGIFPYAAASPSSSVARGFQTSAQSVILTAEAGATIRYTTDGSEPTASTGSLYTGPISINSTTILRAVSIISGANPSTVETFSYIFLDDVIDQSVPSGWPTGQVNDQQLDYGMDPDLVNGQRNAVKTALASLPSISIVTDADNLFDPQTGIYVNAEQKGQAWERPSSIEWLNADNSAGFQIDSGLRMRGGYSRRGSNPKHAFRLFFNGDYDGKLDYPVFGNDGVDTFKKLDLRTAQNYSWSFSGQSKNTFLREVWSRDTQAAMGKPHTRSDYVHVYLNGQYWGLYMTQERVSEEYAEDYFGGSEDDYDVVKHNMSWGSTGGGSPDNGKYEVSNGDDAAWIALWQLVQDQNVNNAEYDQVKEMVDIESLIDNQLIHFYSGDSDSVISSFLANKKANNWYALRDRTGDGTKWIFFAHDAEHSLGSRDHNIDTNRIGPFPVLGANEFYTQEYFNPTWLHQALMSNSQYLEAFRYRAWQHLMDNGGVLTEAEATTRWDQRQAQVQPAMLAESVRWGDAKRDVPRGLSEWQAEVNWVETNWFPNRTPILMDQLINQGLATSSQPAPPATPIEPAATLILNEYNAVDKSEILQENGSDTTFGQMVGNGGDWFELVTVVDNLDIRGWTLEIWDADNFSGMPYRTDRFEFAAQVLLSNLRRGTILTIAEDVADNVSYDPASGDWSINLQANSNDDGAYFTAESQSNFDTNSKAWQLIIRDAAGNLVFGPVGEGVGTLAAGVGNAEIGKLEENPSTSITSNSAYNDGATSTFGAPNLWASGTGVQDFSLLRSVVPLNTPTSIPTDIPTNTPIPPMDTPTNTPVPATDTPTPTNTSVPATNTPTPTNTPVPATDTPTPTNTSVPATNTPTPTNTSAPVASCTTYTSADVPQAMPNGTSQKSSVLTVNSNGTITELTVSVDMDHEWIGDLVLELSHQSSGISAALIDRPGVPASTWGCARDNIAVTLQDNGGAAIESQCASTVPTMNGTFAPEQPLSSFVGQTANGNWTLNMVDMYPSADSGTLNGWSMEICTNSPAEPTPTTTNTPTMVPTATNTSQPGLPTNTPAPTATNTPTLVPTATATQIPTLVPTNTPTATSTPAANIYFEDDFESAQGWSLNPNNSDTATTGLWERGNPESTGYSSYTFQLNNTFSGSNALVTGRLAGNGVGSHDIDNGITSMRSPNITIPSGSATTLSFAYYLSHWNNGTTDDFLRVKVVGSATATVFEQTGQNVILAGQWNSYSINLDAFAGQTIYLVIEAADGGSPSLIEAAIDDIRIADSTVNIAAIDTSAPRDNATILTNELFLPLINGGSANSSATGDGPN